MNDDKNSEWIVRLNILFLHDVIVVIYTIIIEILMWSDPDINNNITSIFSQLHYAGIVYSIMDLKKINHDWID